MYRILTCSCGQQMRVTNEMMGSRGYCAACGKELTVSISNTVALSTPPTPPPSQQAQTPAAEPPFDEPVFGAEAVADMPPPPPPVAPRPSVAAFAPPVSAPQRDGKSQAVAFILSHLLGYFGADQFYLGNILLGVLKIVTFGGCGIWALLDVVLIGCGAKLDADGHPLTRAAAGTPQKSQAVAFLLSFFLGWLGIDRFYLGYTVLGILKLVTLGGFGLWYFIDYLLIGMGVLKDAQGNSLA